MRILLTGGHGFLGQAIQGSFQKHDLFTLGRKASTIVADLRSVLPDLPSVDLVIHSAGKAHNIPRNAHERDEFFDVNVEGTRNLLKGLEAAPPQKFVFISSVAVYGVCSGKMIKETEPLKGQDPYGLSKIKAEQIITDWCKERSIQCTILRLPLIAGPNPPGNLRAMITGIRNGYYLNINGGAARKSMVLATDVARFLEMAANVGGIYNLTDGCHPSFGELSKLIALQLSKEQPRNIPLWAASILARAGDMLGDRFPINSEKLEKMVSDLTFDDSRAREEFGWDPVPVLQSFKIA